MSVILIFSRLIYTVSVVFLIIIGLILVPSLWIYSRPMPEQLGNLTSRIEQIQNKADPNHFTFFVVGDSKGGTKTLEELIESVYGDNPAFIIILGDFIGEPITINHKLFAYEIAELSDKFQFLVVPGNHDVSPDYFTIEDFRTTYGSDQFSFTIGQNLFICLNVVPIYNQDGQYIPFLEQTLDDYSRQCNRTFIFMHVPPAGVIDGVMSRNLPSNEAFLELVRRYNVDYIFAGDHHGYIKNKEDSTTFIVSGGGGARLRGEHGRFFHIIRMAVDNDEINETVIAGKHQIEVTEQLEYNIVVHVFPLLYNHMVYSTICFAAALGYIVYYNINMRNCRLRKQNEKTLVHR